MYPTFLNEPVEKVAQKLLGCYFEREIDGRVVRVRIVETEAYDQDDPASHAFRGKTASNSVMFGESGHLYVYFTYGMHYCCNVVTGVEGYGSGVLTRAAEPVEGVDIIEERRRVSGVNATNGPAKLCQALGIDFQLRGHNLKTSPLKLIAGTLEVGEEVVQTTRVGISKAIDAPRRFYIKDNKYVSKK